MLDDSTWDPLLQVAMKVLAPTRIRSVTGTLALEDVPRFNGAFFLDERGEAEHEKRITSAPPADVSAVESRFSALVPSNDFFFGFVKCPAPDLFALMSAQFSPDQRKLVNSSLAKKNTNLDDFLSKTASHFGDELAVSLSRIDYGAKPERHPFPAVTIYFQVADESGLAEFIHFLTDDDFAIEQLEQRQACGIPYWVGKPKVPIISWAREIAYARVGDRWVVSTSAKALEGSLCVSAKQNPSLFESTAWKQASPALAPSENAIGFVQMTPFLDWASDFSPYLAEKATEITPQRWTDLRAQMEQEVKAQHPNITGPQLDKLVEERLDQIDVARRERDLPQALESLRERNTWLRSLSGLAAGLAFQPERFDLCMGVDFAFMK
ncbi:MAG: hypothetical protein HYR85_11665 [Planctomycetes bacterium]|nr:hypothetical protein [Planctomycetota bacterium]